MKAQTLVMEARDTWLDEEGGNVYRTNLEWEVVEHALKFHRRWEITVFALFETADGDKYTKEEIYALKESCHPNEIGDAILSRLDVVEAEGNSRHFVDRGWKIRPIKKNTERACA